MKKIVCLLIPCIFAVLVFSACENGGDKYYEKSNIVMDTTVTLSAQGKNAKEAVDESFKRLDELNEMASANIDTSDVSKINNGSGDGYVKVHPEILKMIETSIKYSKLSDGAFDITTGPIINLWGIGTDNERLPSADEIKAKLPLVGYEKISINEDESSVMLNEKGMAIDLGGIAKGFAADEVLKIYKKYNIKNGLINLGASSIYAVGQKNNKAWTIGIQHPRSNDAKEYLGVINLSNESLSTSGDYERYFIKDNKRYHHIMDSKTGYPVDNGVMSDTIIVDGDGEDNNMLADLLTTTVFTLGPDKGIKFMNGLSGVCGEITTNDNKIYTSNGFKDRIADLNKDFKFAN